MKKNFFAKALLLTSTIILPVLANAQQATDRYIVKDPAIKSIQAFAVSQGAHLEREMKYFSGASISMSDAVRAKLLAKFPKLSIEKDNEAHIMGVQVKARPGGGGGVVQPAQSIPWGINATHSREANLINRGAGTTVCVVDTGIQADHPDLSGQVIGGENFVVIKGKLDATKFNDDNGHGTHVAGTIAALDNSIGVVGVAPDAKLLAVKVLDSRGSGYNSAVADGIISCVNKGADIISMSLGSSSPSTTVQAAVNTALNAGVLVVAAAGNEAGAVSYPGAFDGVITVTAVDSAMNFASFSNFGPSVDYAAPGVGVTSTTKGSTYATWNGTSMATPHVSGILALTLSSGSLGPVATDIGLSAEQQGNGFLDSLLSVNNQ